MRLRKNTHRFFTLLFIGIPLLQACIWEELSDCPEGIILELHRNISEEAHDHCLPANRMSVFIFDGEGYFHSRIDQTTATFDNGHQIVLPLAPGEYRAVVWVGTDDELYRITPESGKSIRLEDFRLQLLRENDRLSRNLRELWHGIPNLFTVARNEMRIVPVEMYKLTNNIRVVLSGLPDDVSCSVDLSDNNGTYDFRSRILPDDTFMYYPHTITSRPGTWRSVHDLCVMKLDNSRHPVLEITDSRSGAVLFRADAILKLLTADPFIDFTLDHFFEIELIFNEELTVTAILVNGWEVIPEETGL